MPENARISANNFQKALLQLQQYKAGKVLRIGDLKSYFLSLQPLMDLPWLLGELESR